MRATPLERDFESRLLFSSVPKRSKIKNHIKAFHSKFVKALYNVLEFYRPFFKQIKRPRTITLDKK